MCARIRTPRLFPLPTAGVHQRSRARVTFLPPCVARAPVCCALQAQRVTHRKPRALKPVFAMLPGAPRPGGVRFGRAGSARASARLLCTPYRMAVATIVLFLMFTLSRLLSKKPAMSEVIASDEVASMLLARAEAAEKKAAVRWREAARSVAFPSLGHSCGAAAHQACARTRLRTRTRNAAGCAATASRTCARRRHPPFGVLCIPCAGAGEGSAPAAHCVG
ncbi:hypothetical protein EON67_00355, partial [archaeon]